SARLDCLILLGDALGKDRAWLLANGDEVLSVKTQSQLKNAVNRRASHEPIAYIRGKSEFFGREFTVTPATLQPRPETETMIELLSKLITPHFKNYKARPCNMRIVDVGTGSGCLAVTVKLEWPEAIVHAIDINEDA